MAPSTRPGEGDGLGEAVPGPPLPVPDGVAGVVEAAPDGGPPPAAGEPPLEDVVTAGEPPPPEDDPPPEELADGLGLALGLAEAAVLGAGEEEPPLLDGGDEGDGPDDAGGIWPLVLPPGPVPPPMGPPTWLLLPPEAAPVLAFTPPPSWLLPGSVPPDGPELAGSPPQVPLAVHAPKATPPGASPNPTASAITASAFKPVFRCTRALLARCRPMARLLKHWGRRADNGGLSGC